MPVFNNIKNSYLERTTGTVHQSSLLPTRFSRGRRARFTVSPTMIYRCVIRFTVSSMLRTWVDIKYRIIGGKGSRGGRGGRRVKYELSVLTLRLLFHNGFFTGRACGSTHRALINTRIKFQFLMHTY